MYPVKKTLNHPKADQKEQEIFNLRIEAYQRTNTPIVYLDESGFELCMPRTHGYQSLGTRVYDCHNWQARKRTNAIGAIISNEFITVSLFETSINGDIFHAWVTQDLLPKLPNGCVIVMDNASFHKRSDTLQAITDHESIIEWLPKYSPHLNPIETKWGNTKRIRRTERCEIDDLFNSKVSYVTLL